MRQINYRGAEAEVNDTSSTEARPLGTRMYTPGGRVFRRTKAGATALTIGTLVRRPEREEFHCDLAVAAAVAIDALVVTATLTGAATVADEYEGGILYVNDGAGQGYSYNVVGNTAAAKAGTVSVDINDGPIVALTTSSKVTLIKSKYNGVLTSEFGVNEQPIGLVPCAVTAGYHFWMQTAGPAVALQEGALYENCSVGPSAKTKGAVSAATVAIAAPDLLDSSLAQGTSRAVCMDVEGNDRLVDVRTVAVLAASNIVGFCLDPRVDTDFALIEMTLE